MAASPERHAVLLAIQEQCAGSGRLGEATWTSEQWHSAFEHLFYRDATSHSHDDLLFLVDRPAPGHPCSSFRVQRRAKGSTLPPELCISGKLWPSVAWQQTVILNLVVQSTYELTVTSCRQDLLSHVAEGLDVSCQAVCVTKQVYASPSQTRVNLEAGKAEAEPSPAYPAIHFSVEDYDDAFQDLVLTQPDDCFCVVLRAILPAVPTPSSNPLNNHMVLFSGYVVHKQIREHLGSRLQPFKSPLAGVTALLTRLFGKDQDQPSGRQEALHRHAVYMRGPGGVGLAEVAVCAMPERLLPGHATDPGTHAAAVHSTGQTGAQLGALQCALMSVGVPVDVLATNILAGIF